jgi:hypothetical protein
VIELERAERRYRQLVKEKRKNKTINKTTERED